MPHRLHPASDAGTCAGRAWRLSLSCPAIWQKSTQPPTEETFWSEVRVLGSEGRNPEAGRRNRWPPTAARTKQHHHRGPHASNHSADLPARSEEHTSELQS